MRQLIIAVAAVMITASCTYNIYLPASPASCQEEKSDWRHRYVPSDIDPMFSEPVEWWYGDDRKGFPIGNGVILEGGDSTIYIEMTGSMWIDFPVDTIRSTWDTIYQLTPLR